MFLRGVTVAVCDVLLDLVEVAANLVGVVAGQQSLGVSAAGNEAEGSSGAERQSE